MRASAGEAQTQGQPAERGVVVEEQREHRQQKQHRQQSVGHRPGYPVAQRLEGRRPRGELTRGEAAEEPRPQAQQSVPERGTHPGHHPAFQAHQRRAAEQVRQGGHKREPDEHPRELDEGARVAGRNHGADQHIDRHRRGEGQNPGADTRHRETDQVAGHAPATGDGGEVPHAGGPVVRQRPVQQPRILEKLPGSAGAGALRSPGGRIEDPIPAARARKEGHGPAVFAAESQHGAAVPEPPPILCGQPHATGAHPRRLHDVVQGRLKAVAHHRGPDGDALVPADRLQRGHQRVSAGGRVLRTRAGKGRQTPPRGDLFAVALNDLRRLQIGFVRQHQPAVGRFGAERQPVKLRQRPPHQGAGVQLGGGDAGDAVRATQRYPCIPRDRHQTRFLGDGILRLEEGGLQGLAADPHHSVASRQDAGDQRLRILSGLDLEHGGRTRCHRPRDGSREVLDPGVGPDGQRPGEVPPTLILRDLVEQGEGSGSGTAGSPGGPSRRA